jgi:hypothetical protein|tara:strand:- start:6582 stop:7031 length:450 start_codon:yes stop_codon:yes gene_type:complete
MVGHRAPGQAVAVADKALLARQLLELLAAGKSWAEIEAEIPTARTGRFSAAKVLRWAIEQHMPAEAVKTGRNVWLARYRLLLEAWWPRAIGAAGQAPEADATAIVMKIGREVRDMLALDAPKQTGGAAVAGGEVTVTIIDATEGAEADA